MMRIVEPRLRIHEVPLEKIHVDAHSVAIELDDENEARWRLYFAPIQAVRITTEDCICNLDIAKEIWEGNVGFPDGDWPQSHYRRYLMEKADSPWIHQLRDALRQSCATDNFTQKSHHYVMHVGDNLWEIVSRQAEITKIITPEKE